MRTRSHEGGRAAGRNGSPREPITIGGVTFRPGDLVHADDDGVVLLPAGPQEA
ncbi:hypothetical protein ABT144_35155 [Streptomyces sp. NPDC002039]|uniref:RraA family protein n=1 Tax=Streptomyces sp. NPDC002039 TaxID=3154660 RepID=UPI003316594E